MGVLLELKKLKNTAEFSCLPSGAELLNQKFHLPIVISQKVKQKFFTPFISNTGCLNTEWTFYFDYGNDTICN